MKRLTVLLCLLLAAAPAMADEYHYTNIIIGERASGMGGAYTAVSDDPAGLYYNPAGIVYSTGRSLSASVNAYHNSTKEYEGVIGGNGWKRSSSSLLPNFFGIIQPVGDVRIGLSYAVPDSMREDQDELYANLPSTIPGVTVNQYILNFNNEDNTYLFGPTIAAPLGKDGAVGLTLYFEQRRYAWTMNQNVSLSNGTWEWSNEYFESEETGIRPVLGFMYAPAEKMSVGLTVARTFVLDGSNNYQKTLKPTTSATFNRYDVTTGERRKYPYQVTLGGAWFPSNSFLLSADVSWFSGDGYTMFRNTAFETREARRQVVNAAVGMEYYLTRNWALRAGAYSNMANTPDVTTGRLGQLEQIDMYGLTLAMSHYTRNTSVTMGLGYGFGDGKAQVVPSSGNIQDVKLQSWTMYISSSYNY